MAESPVESHRPYRQIADLVQQLFTKNVLQGTDLEVLKMRLGKHTGKHVTSSAIKLFRVYCGGTGC